MDGMTSARFIAAIAAIDQANAADPTFEASDGKACPKELLYAERMTRWLARLAPDASEALQLAARAQHIERWRVPRGDFPMDRQGYHRWRASLARFHAERAGEILRAAGYDEGTVGRVQGLIRKERLKADPEVQLLEDVICLVFLESYFTDFSAKHDEAKLLGILRKTWTKMSPRGRALARELELPEAATALLAKALA